jgi:hypothetical protein
MEATWVAWTHLATAHNAKGHPVVATGGVMKELLAAGIAVTAFGVMQAFAADVHVPSSSDPLAGLPYVPEQPRLPDLPRIPVFSWTACYLGFDFGGRVPDTVANGQFVDPVEFCAPTTVAISSGSNDTGSATTVAGGQVDCDVQIARHRVIDFAADAARANVSGTAQRTESKGLIGPVIQAWTAVSSSGSLVLKADAIAAATDRFKLAIIAVCIYVANNYPWLLLLLSIPAALSCVAWVTFQVFKSQPNVLSNIGALLGWGGFSVACLGGGCSYFLSGPYTIQIVSWGGFGWIAGVYVTLTWAKLWEQRGFGATPAQSVQTIAGLSQPQPDSAPNSFCYELLVVERWLRVINEHKPDSYEACGSNSEGEQISCSVREVGKEGQNFRRTQGDVLLLMRGQSSNRRRTQSSPPRGHHWHRRARCTRPVLS